MPRLAWILIGALVAVGAAWWIVRGAVERAAPIVEEVQAPVITKVNLDAPGLTQPAVVADQRVVAAAPLPEDVIAHAEPTTATLSGVLVIPRSWGTTAVQIRATLVEFSVSSAWIFPQVAVEPPIRVGEFEMYPWRMEDVHVGEYEISVAEPPYAVTVRLLPQGTHDVRIQVPPPATVSLRVVDANTDLDVQVERVAWTPTRHGASTGVIWNQVEPGPGINTLDFRCPAGEMTISPVPAERGYAARDFSFELHEGDNVLILPLTRATGLALTIMNGTEILPDSHCWKFEVTTSVDGTRCGSWLRGSTGASLEVETAGRYRIRAREEIAGFFQPEDQIVDLMSGTMTDVVIRLVRKP